MKIITLLKPLNLFTLCFLVLSGFSLFSCTKEVQSSNALQPLAASLSSSADLGTSAGIDTAGLVAWYDFNGGSLKDRSSHHNNIKFNNAQLTTDRKGVANNAYYFDGMHNYMRVANSPSLNPDRGITMFAIVKVNDFYEGLCHGNRILNKSFVDSDPGIYYLSFDDAIFTNQMNCSQDVDKNHEAFTGAYGNTPYRSTGANDLTGFIQKDHWYHIVFTYGNGTTYFYVDGKLVFKTRTGDVEFNGNASDLYIGTENKFNSQYPYWFNGAIDQIAIFNVALNAEQVAKLSNY